MSECHPETICHSDRLLCCLRWWTVWCGHATGICLRRPACRGCQPETQARCSECSCLLAPRCWTDSSAGDAAASSAGRGWKWRPETRGRWPRDGGSRSPDTWDSIGSCREAGSPARGGKWRWRRAPSASWRPKGCTHWSTDCRWTVHAGCSLVTSPVPHQHG